jgi:hypothetical protein
MLRMYGAMNPVRKALAVSTHAGTHGHVPPHPQLLNALQRELELGTNGRPFAAYTAAQMAIQPVLTSKGCANTSFGSGRAVAGAAHTAPHRCRSPAGASLDAAGPIYPHM